MKSKFKVLIAVAAAAVLVIAGTVTAMVASANTLPAGVTRPTDADYAAWGCPVFGQNDTAVTSLLGMSQQEINTQLQQGKSLADIAASKGITNDQLVAAMIAPMKTFMQQQVTNGVWTQAQADARLKLAQQRMGQIINIKGGTGAGFGGCFGAGFNSAAGANGGTGYGPGPGRMMGGFNGSNAYRGGMMGGSRSY
jgi:hypothetical protein